MKPRKLYEKYAGAMAYVAVETPEGDERLGSAFHVGEGVFVTARHVVEGNRILNIGTTERVYVPDPNGLVTIHGKSGTFRSIEPAEGQIISGPHFHPDETVDVAVFKVDGLEPQVVPLGSHLDDWINDEAFILASVLVMGYPPIPFSKRPLLVAARAEVNAVVDKYTGRHPHFVISAMARGGFSGGLCLIEWDFALGMVTESLFRDDQPSELGFMAVLTVEPIYECLAKHKLLPAVQREMWEDFWNSETIYYGVRRDFGSEHRASITIHDDGIKPYVLVSSQDHILLKRAVAAGSQAIEGGSVAHEVRIMLPKGVSDVDIQTLCRNIEREFEKEGLVKILGTADKGSDR